jgi:hypothetical protein
VVSNTRSQLSGISFVKLLGQNFSLRYPEAWLICAPNPLIWAV